MTERLVSCFLGAEAGIADWRVAELANRKRILASWLSEVEAAGGTLDPGAARFLARARRRVRALHTLGAELAATHPVTVVKGPVIARHMPAGLLRQSADIDLVASGEESLWQVVLDIRRRRRAVVRGISVLRGEDGDRQLGVWLTWPAEEPLLDKPMGADVGTCPFVGDLSRVPVRTARPDDDDLLSLFAVTEKRFRRRFRVKDQLDLAVLVPVLVRTYGDDLTDTVCGWADELSLAPELLELSRQVHARRELPEEWLRVLDRLAGLAERERNRREAGGRRIHRASYGLALSDAHTGDRLSIHSSSDNELATTPAGTFLLVDSGTIGASTHEQALAVASGRRAPAAH